MSSAQPVPQRSLRLPRLPWLHVLIIAGLMISRRPDAVFHPQFWAEDGEVFYHDAYTLGLKSLWRLQDGYFQTLSRLTALGAAELPLVWGPATFASIAGLLQLLPVIFVLSQRMDTALPSWCARLAIAYFYTVMPNEFELNINLTNAQWHLALLAFLIITATPPRTAYSKAADRCLLVLFGLTGPFAIFLAPIAVFRCLRQGSRYDFANAAIILVGAGVQGTAIICSHATSSRLVTPLGASAVGLGKIILNNIVVGGLLGDGLMSLFPVKVSPGVDFFIVLVMGMAMCLIVLAVRKGPMIYREFLLFGTLTYVASLVSPVSSVHEILPQWIAMARPGFGIRYCFVPTLVWFSTLVVLLSVRSPVRNIVTPLLATICLCGIYVNWRFPPFHATDFSVAAARFEASKPGTEMIFPENPPGWAMTLAKH